MISYDSSLKIYYSSLINDDNYFSGFGTRDLGDGRRVETIIKFLKTNNINFKKIVIPDQIHSVNIEIFETKNSDLIERIEDTDGVITREKNVVLTVVTADCLPMIVVDKKQGLIGISHQGWRGSIKKMAQKMINKMKDQGSDIGDIKVGLGPHIGQCCYNIDEDRYYQFKQEFNGYTDKIFHWQKGQWHLNLGLLNYLLLQDVGLKPNQIDFFPFCTKCNKKQFFSFRRDKKEDYGEMVSFILKNYE